MVLCVSSSHGKGNCLLGVFRLQIKVFSYLCAVALVAGCSEEHLPEDANGRELYNYHCAGCHQETGVGKFFAGIPSNANTEMSSYEVVQLIQKGKQGKEGMPVFEQLTKREAILIAGYLKQLQP